MNYYPRYPGDYLAKTLDLTMVEDGAYTRLLDWYYSNERPIAHERRYVVSRATTAAERHAVDTVLTSFFERDGELLGKDYAQALSQLATAAARMAELGIRTGESSGPSAVNFQLNIGAAPVGPAYAAPPPGPSGDVIEVG